MFVYKKRHRSGAYSIEVLRKDRYSLKTGFSKDGNHSCPQIFLGLLVATGQLEAGREYDLDFDHEFLEAEKYDAEMTYKHLSVNIQRYIRIEGIEACGDKRH